MIAPLAGSDDSTVSTYVREDCASIRLPHAKPAMRRKIISAPSRILAPNRTAAPNRTGAARFFIIMAPKIFFPPTGYAGSLLQIDLDKVRTILQHATDTIQNRRTALLAPWLIPDE